MAFLGFMMIKELGTHFSNHASIRIWNCVNSIFFVVTCKHKNNLWDIFDCTKKGWKGGVTKFFCAPAIESSVNYCHWWSLRLILRCCILTPNTRNEYQLFTYQSFDFTRDLRLKSNIIGYLFFLFGFDFGFKILFNLRAVLLEETSTKFMRPCFRWELNDPMLRLTFSNSNYYLQWLVVQWLSPITLSVLSHNPIAEILEHKCHTLVTQKKFTLWRTKDLPCFFLVKQKGYKICRHSTSPLLSRVPWSWHQVEPLLFCDPWPNFEFHSTWSYFSVLINILPPCVVACSA